MIDNYINLVNYYWFKIEPDTRRIFDSWMDSKHKLDSRVKPALYWLLKEAEKGNLLHWLATKEGYIAHTILLDQISRIYYRNTENEFKNCYKCILFIEMGYDLYISKLNLLEKIAIFIPYLYIEDIDIQKNTSLLLKVFIEKENRSIDKNILKVLQYNLLSRCRVLEHFGRFPKRNYLLGRLSTEEEIDYIDSREGQEY
jgi:uncharacterized protein (DUF924 family)